MAQLIKYDFAYMSSGKVGKFGFKQNDLSSLGKKIGKINQNLVKKKNLPEMSFRDLPYDLKTVGHINQLVKKLGAKFDNLVVVGIGGSDLGAKALCRALSWQDKKELYFSGDTTDPESLHKLLANLDLKRTVFYIVSKSGDTLETIVNFLFWREQVINKVGYKNHKQHFVITTNTEKGKLLDMAKKEGYQLLPHFAGGGRFSVLSVNGLLPAAWIGLDLKKILNGAKSIDLICKKSDWRKNSAFIFAALHYLAYKKHDQKITVLMPYVEALNSFAFWFRQLWAESLGKKYDLNGKVVNVGLTPIAASGPKDQHSQLQLYNEGYNDKNFTFIEIEKLRVDFLVPLYKNIGLDLLAKKKYSEILKIEQQAVAVSLMKNQRPNGTIILPQLDEYNLGQLFMFFEMAVVYLGELLGINIFDQPGVEDSKKMMYKMLGK
jgi:glucose-6-phosphate isomerase